MMKRNKKRRALRTGLSKLAEERLRQKLRRTAPSEPWVDVQFISVADRQDDRAIAVRIHNPDAFPPGGSKTAMKCCPRCGVMTPPFAFEGGICLDHRERGEWGPSPSARAIAALQHMNLRLVDSPLPSESTAALRRQIARFLEKKGGKHGTVTATKGENGS
jgi:hypothetical protein